MATTAKRTANRTAQRAASASYTTLTLDVHGGIARLALARPDVHNAFDEMLIAELTAALTAIDGDASVRLLVLQGEGKSFCAGADLNWMRRMAAFSRPQNLADAKALAAMLATLDTLSKPTIARVHGAAFGGGVGLVACCDIAIAVPEATFALSEAKLGLIPATIGPYVVAAIGARNARRYMLTAERFGAADALRIGLVHEVVGADRLDARISDIVRTLLAAGPDAQREAKDLVHAVAARPVDAAVIADTARRIARVRASAEGKEGVAAFLDKRTPGWVPRSEEG